MPGPLNLIVPPTHYGTSFTPQTRFGEPHDPQSPQGGGGSFSMLITGEAGEVYNVQMSSNLVEWTNVATVTNVTGSVLYTEPVPTNETQRYYRAKVAE